MDETWHSPSEPKPKPELEPEEVDRSRCVTCDKPLTRELIRELHDKKLLVGESYRKALDEVWVSDEGECADCTDIRVAAELRSAGRR